MKEYPCKGSKCQMGYNAIESVKSCKLFYMCNFYEPDISQETKEYMRMILKEFERRKDDVSMP